jgi:uncharacterized tellurite resistance protein B-like protein
MLKAITDFFDRNLSGAAAAGNERHTIEVAAAALIVEVMRMDGEVTPEERAVALGAVRGKFGLGEAEAKQLMDLAEAEAKTANDYYQFTSLINKRFTQAQKERIVELMWEVAYADAAASPYEEHFIRKLADLLYVEHHAYIRAKLKARDGAPRPS